MKMRTIKHFLAACFLLVFATSIHAQEQGTKTYLPKFAIKTNALYWATSTPNLGFEVALAKKLTLDVSGNYNPWKFSKDRQIKHWLVQPELRYWLCERFNGHFFGLHAGYTEYNISNVRIPFRPASSKDHRYQGWGTGVGISYGYSWIIGRRWNLEATVGVGYVYTDYDKYDCVTCGTFRGTNTKHYFGPTKIGISFVYIIK